MPIGSRHDEVGLLDREGGELVLHRAGGGRWRLEAGPITAWRMHRLLGHQIRIDGMRIAFDVLHVRTFEASRLETIGW